MSSTIRLFCLIGLALLESAALAGCSAEANAVPPAASPSAPMASANSPASSELPVATLKELMDSTVDPAADGLWEAVSVTATAKGIDRHQPRTPEEWAAVRRHAITLIEAMNLVVMPGRHAAPAGAQPGLGELPPQQIELRIEQQRAAYTGFASALRATALQALAAIDRKDPEALLKIGSDIDAQCEACHVTFWYPQANSSQK